MKSYAFWLKFVKFVPKVKLPAPSIGLDNGLAPDRRQAII